MFYFQAAQAPVHLRLDESRVAEVPVFLMKDTVDWCSEIVAARMEQSFENLDAEQQAQLAALFPVTAPDINELRRMVLTPDGAVHVVKTQLAKAKIKEWALGSSSPKATLPNLTAEEVSYLINNQSHKRLVDFAFVIAQMNDSARVNPFEKPEDKQKDVGEKSPLT